MLLKEYFNPERMQFDTSELSEIGYQPYNDNVPDWTMVIWLVIICLDGNAVADLTEHVIANRANYIRVLPRAIELVRTLGITDEYIDIMTRIVQE